MSARFFLLSFAARALPPLSPPQAAELNGSRILALIGGRRRLGFPGGFLDDLRRELVHVTRSLA